MRSSSVVQAVLFSTVLQGFPAAWAGGDGLGSGSPAADASPGAPLVGLTSAGSGQLVLRAQGEYVKAPIVRELVVEDGVERDVLLDDVGLVRLSAAYSPSERLWMGVSAPVVLASTGSAGEGGPALGTLEIAAGYRLLGSPAERGWLGVGPQITVPLGPAKRWLRDHSPSAGVSAMGGFRAGPLVVAGSLGVEYRDVRAEGENLSAGPGVRGVLSAALPLADRAAISVDVATRGSGGSYPVELGLGYRQRLGEAVALDVRVARGLVAGPGSPAVRATAGVSWTLPRSERVAPPPEPVEEGPALVVLDPLGRALSGAVVSRDGDVLGRSDLRGRVPLRLLRRGGEVQVERPGYQPTTLDPAGREDVEVRLGYAPVPAQLEVVDQLGQPVDATVRFVSDEAQLDAVASGGELLVQLEPGTYYATVTAEGYSEQQRVFVAAPGRSTALRARILLAPEVDAGDANLALVLRDGAGRPVEGAEIRIDGVAYGTSGSGGTVSLGGLLVGAHRIEVRGERYAPTVLDAVDLIAGRNEVEVELLRQPGGLRLRVRGPEGPVTDAVVRLVGPARLPAYPLGDNGARMFQLRPGRWTLVVTSEAFGVQSTEVLIDPDDGGIAEVDVFMQQPEGGSAELTVLAVDRDGRPLSDVAVLLDGVQIGTTSTGGRITVPGLFTGERRVELRGERYQAQADRYELVDGPQELNRVVSWVQGATSVIAHTPRSAVADGVARFTGRRAIDPLELGSEGQGFAQLPTGEWTVVVSSEEHGLAQQNVVVGEVEGRLAVADVVFRPADTGAADLRLVVQDPQRRGVPGAEVRFDGVYVGRTNDRGELVLSGIAAGPRTVSARSDLLQEVVREARLSDGDNDIALQMPWAPGAVRVVAEGPDGVVSDAVVRFIGPEPRTPLTLGAEGERLTALSPGRWQGIASSPTLGLAQTEVVIEEEASGLRTVRFAFEPVARGQAELLVRVVDPLGNALVGANVEIAGQAPRQTGPAGAVLLRNLPVADVSIALNADRHYPRELRGVELRSGSQERVIELVPVPGTVQATVVDGEGNPVSGQLRFLGPVELEPVPFDGGYAEAELPPGAWRILAAAEGFAVASAELDIPPGAETYPLNLQLEPARVELVDGDLIIGDAVLFDTGEAELRSDAEAVIDEVATYLLADPSLLDIEVQGHTDSTGSLALNYTLSSQRADAVLAALVARGVPPERLVARGYGPSRPLADNASLDGRARNRRVQFVVQEAP